VTSSGEPLAETVAEWEPGTFVETVAEWERGTFVETVAELERGTFVENLAAGTDGSWLVTIPSHRRIDRVDRDGQIAVFAELDRMPTGIVTDATGTLVLAGSIGIRD
jgi:hypothetical protein